MIPKCSLNGYNDYIKFFGLLFMAFILVVVVMFYLQARHAEITEKYNNINTSGNIDMTTIEFKPPTDAGNRSTFPEDKYPGANYELTRSTVRTAVIGAVGPSSSVSDGKPPEPRTTDIYKMRDCKVYFTDDIDSCDNQVESSTKTCSYKFDGWKEFDTYTDNNGNTLTYPIKKYKPDASNTNELINSHFTSKCFKEFDNDGKGTAKRFEYKENRLVKFDSKGVKDNTEIDTNIFGGKRFTSIQFMNGENPRDNLTNVIDSICSVKYNKIQVLNGKTFYKFILRNREITSIQKLSLKEDQSEFDMVGTEAINDFAILGSHGLRFDDSDNLQIFINETAITANMNIFKFTYVSNLCSNSQIKNYAMYPANLRITDFLLFGAVAENAKKERTIDSNSINTSLITNKDNYKGKTADGKYIDYKKTILDDLEGRRQSEIKALQDASENRKTGYNNTINSINNEIKTATNKKRDFTVQDNTFLNVLNLYNNNGRRIFDYASGYKNNRLSDIPIPEGAEAIFMDSSDICFVFKNNTAQDHKWYWFEIPQGETYVCDVLVVGGGGGGGHFGGGGGGGGVLFRKNVNITGTFVAGVGKGGKGVPPGYNRSYDTGEATINGRSSAVGINNAGFWANGGGGGGTRNGWQTGWRGRRGFDGGSGGGGSHSNEPDTQGMGGNSNRNSYSGWESYGNAGGKGKPSWMRCNSNNQGCYYSGEPSHASGGGGGAGGRGGDFSYDTGGGDGGRGLDYSGTFGKNVGDNGFFAGGGGGNTYHNAGRAGYGNGGNGLFGGGGNGGMDWVDTGYNAMDGKPNSGGGGGGGRWWWYWWSDYHAKGGDGGSGIVILRIKKRIQIMAITNSFEGFYNEAPVTTITMPPLRIQSNILTSFVYLQKGFYRFRADLGNMGKANPNIIYAELVVYDESNLRGAQYICKKVFKYNLYNNRYRPSYLRQYIDIPTNKFYKIAYSYYYMNNTGSNKNEQFQLYYRYLATAPESLEGTVPSDLIAWYRFDGSIDDINPNTSLPKYHLVDTKNRLPNYPDDTFQEKSYVNTSVGGVNGAFKTRDNIDLAGKSFSISVWMRTKSNDHCYFICQGNHAPHEGCNRYLHIGHRGNGQYLIGFWCNDLEYNSSGGRAYPEDANQWVHMVFVVDVAINKQSCGRRMYRNGALIAEDRGRGLYQGQGKLYIGQLAAWGEQHYNYNMDISDFMLYNKALTAKEAESLFKNTPSPSETPVKTTYVSLNTINDDSLFSPNAINSINTPMNQFLFNGTNINAGYKNPDITNVFSTIKYVNNDYAGVKSFQNLATYIDTDSIDYFSIRILTNQRTVQQGLIDGEGARLTGEIRGSTTIANLNTLTNAIKSIDYKGLLPVGNPQLLSGKTFTSIFGSGNEASYITIDKVRDLNNLANPELSEAVYIEALN